MEGNVHDASTISSQLWNQKKKDGRCTVNSQEFRKKGETGNNAMETPVEVIRKKKRTGPELLQSRENGVCNTKWVAMSSSTSFAQRSPRKKEIGGGGQESLLPQKKKKKVRSISVTLVKRLGERQRIVGRWCWVRMFCGRRRKGLRHFFFQGKFSKGTWV